ncbi:MAG: zf-HC2 domain-containing protein [Candidatus Zixiibacteriota bacterium]|nr:MAG: zf-HC2 domain-containing protein [candidate division Zixibacteria bacterium]
MSECNDLQYKDMLHAFELGLLTEEDRQQFEMHLLECEYCFSQVEDFLPASKMMRHDPDVRPGDDEMRDLLAADASREEDVTSVSGKTWSRYSRFLALAAMLIVVGVPSYWLLFRETAAPPTVQVISLTPVRGGTPAVLYLEDGGIAEIRFTVEGVEMGADIKVRIIVRSGDVVYEADYDEVADVSGNGVISLPMTDFEPGFYKLIFLQPSDTTLAPLREYNFRVR